MAKQAASSIQFINIAGMEGFELVCGRNVENPFPQHLHRTHCVGTLTEGEALLVYDSVGYPLHKHSIYLINPGDAHTIQPVDDRGFKYLVLSLAPDRLTSSLSRQSIKGIIRFSTVTLVDESISNKISGLGHLCKESRPLLEVEFELMLILSDLAHLLIDDIPLMSVQSETIHDICGWLEQVCSQNLTLQQLADRTLLSKYHFARMFKTYTGISPYDYQIQARIKNARRLLLENHSISDIALELGFADQSHFTRLFKKYVGITPAQYRRSLSSNG